MSSAELTDALGTAKERAADAIDNGTAADLLQRWAELSGRLAAPA
mgnify:FL=1